MNRGDARRAGEARNYQYRCPRTGTVKAYKRMTGEQARVLNQRLAARGNWGCWVLAAPSPEPADHPRALAPGCRG